MKQKRVVKGILSVILTLAMVFGAVPLPGVGSVLTVKANAPDKTITGLGTGAIGHPAVPADYADEWLGSYVYYGAYNNKPIKYRVLDPDATKFGGTTMFLDCNTILYKLAFDADMEANQDGGSPNIWAYSDIKKV